MLTKVHLKSVASYDGIGAKFDDLKKVNFIYGNNGCGKSTFSNLFYNSQDVKYIHSNLEYTGDLQYLVYNKGFIDDNFKSDSLPGIFTLGKDFVELENKINELEEQIEKNKDKIIEKDKLIEETKEELKKNEELLVSAVWKNKTDKSNKWFPVYQKVFKGLNNSKINFYKHFLSFSENIFEGEQSLVFERANQLFNETVELEDEIYWNPAYLEIDNDIFVKPIVGNKEVDIANMISKLHISDWVEEGKAIIENNNLDICPLCQTTISEKLKNDLEQYFNEAYKMDIEKIKAEIEKFDLFSKNLISEISELSGNKYFGKYTEQLYVKLENLTLKIQQQFESKLTSPSNVIHLNFSELANLIDEIKELLKDTNEKIKNNNQLVNNIESEIQQVIRDVQNIFAQSIAHITIPLLKNLKSIEGKINGLEGSKESLKKINFELQGKKEDLLKESVGIKESSININKQLKSFGFENFMLKEEVGTGKYSIVRENGELANTSLSEGEKTFITFLYYYQKVVNEIQDNVKKKILIIDDPISSLDSTVMYIVSSLIKDLIKRLENSENFIEQIIILTHNTYFYKEVTYKVSEKNDFAKYFVLRKQNNTSKAYEYSSNPIRTSYEELWRELETVKDTSSNIIQNVMRRILENYFRFLGEIKLQDLCEPFEESSKPIVNSLVMWTHDGSHSIQDELYIEQSLDLNQKYYQVFKEIFIKHNQEAHFNMMVDKCFNPENKKVFEITQLQSA